ncbi:MAG: hypothetical protein AB7I04_13470 [Pseudomonadales bacterium]
MSWPLWARLWSPLADSSSFREAWQALGIEGDVDALQAGFIGTFHYGAPLPEVPLLLHHTLNLPGDSAREEWMRVMSWLNLKFGEVRLPPDHLAIACDVLAVVEQRGEALIREELVRRYLQPWCLIASKRLTATGSALLALPSRFAAELAG